jgi:hypothetical protein
VASIFVSWSHVFCVRPVGRLKGPIGFDFYNGFNKRIATTITNFSICERTPKAQWRPVWTLAGKERLNDITYGGKFAGLKETLGAKKLVVGKLFGAFASDGSGGSAGRYFRFKKQGTIELPNSPD